MKKIIMAVSLVCVVFSISHAQLSPVEKKQSPVKITKTPPPSTTAAPPPPPAPVSKTTNNTDAAVPVYTLTSARVSIRTGSDNKEFPSQVMVLVAPRSTPVSAASSLTQLQLTNEMRINSETEFGLERSVQHPGDANLQSFLNSGLKLRILYLPNFFADAWKIENVSITLEFKDQNGNLHPTLGRKTIFFSTASGFLNNEYRNLECFADGNFMPVTAVIKK